MQHLRSICILSMLALFGSISAFSQAVNATLLGTVTDTTGAIVVNGKVTATDAGTNISRTVQTNSSGNYSFPDLPPGQYIITAELAGLQNETPPNNPPQCNTPPALPPQHH